MSTNISNLPSAAEAGISCETRVDGCQVSLSGRISIDSTPDLRATLLQQLQAAQCPCLTIDFYKVDYIDTSGLAVLVEVLRAAHQLGKRLRLSRLRERPRYLFETTRLLHFFDESPDDQSANASREEAK